MSYEFFQAAWRPPFSRREWIMGNQECNGWFLASV
jgi:hypothetical protein